MSLRPPTSSLPASARCDLRAGCHILQLFHLMTWLFYRNLTYSFNIFTHLFTVARAVILQGPPWQPDSIFRKGAFILTHETSLSVVTNWDNASEKVKAHFFCLFCFSPLKQEQPPSYSFVFRKDKPPVTITQVQLYFLIPWPPMKVHGHSHPFPGWEKPQSSWLKGKITHFQVVFVKTVLFRSRGPILSMQKKTKPYILSTVLQVYSTQFKKQTNKQISLPNQEWKLSSTFSKETYRILWPACKYQAYPDFQSLLIICSPSKSERS